MRLDFWDSPTSKADKLDSFTSTLTGKPHGTCDSECQSMPALELLHTSISSLLYFSCRMADSVALGSGVFLAGDSAAFILERGRRASQRGEHIRTHARPHTHAHTLAHTRTDPVVACVAPCRCSMSQHLGVVSLVFLTSEQVRLGRVCVSVCVRVCVWMCP
jgi:hypothetical protein